MQSFLDKHAARISGVISCFDRMLFRGYLPILSGYAMAQFLCHEQIRYQDLKSFLLSNAAVLRDHAFDLARQEGRPYIYLASCGVRKEERARAIAAEDAIEEGLVCIFAQLEPCNTFSFRYERGQAFVKPARRKCLHLYYYFMDRDFGLIHVMVLTWFPMRKGVANLFRYRDVSLAANAPYLNALAIVDDPSTAIRQLHSITARKRTRSGQSVRAFNPLSEEDQRLFKAVLSGDNAIQKRGRIQFA